MSNPRTAEAKAPGGSYLSFIGSIGEPGGRAENITPPSTPITTEATGPTRQGQDKNLPGGRPRTGCYLLAAACR